MFQNLIASFFECSHRRTTFPMTRGRKNFGAQATSANNRTYVVCLDCGKEFAYDWKSMQVGEAVEISPAAAAAEPLYR
jgi:hypothetical protein